MSLSVVNRGMVADVLEREAFIPPAMRRIAIIGTTGAGKTTLALRLAQRLHVPHVELDSLYWEADWQPVTRELFRERVSLALNAEAWVTDGNYGQARDLIWGGADTLIWLDMPLMLALWRVISRTLGRIVTGAELWNGNRETIGNALFSRDGLVLYLFKSRRQHKKSYPQFFTQPEYAHLNVIRLSSPRQVSRWLEGIDPEGLQAR